MVPAERINRTSATSRKVGRNTTVSLQNMGIHPPKQVTEQSPSPLKTCKLNTPAEIWETRLASTIQAKEAGGMGGARAKTANLKPEAEATPHKAA